MSRDAAQKKIHFIWDPHKPDVCAFAHQMTALFNQAAPDEADLIVAIGGDGTALYALDHANGVPVFAMTMPGIKSSEGFLTCHKVVGASNLMDIVNDCTPYDLTVLEGTVEFENGHTETHHTCADIVIEKLKVNGGTTLDLKAEFNGNAMLDMPRIGSNGLVVATPLASTGYHLSNGGRPISLRNDRVTLSAITPYKPRHFGEHVFDPDTVITITAPPRTYNKRPLGVGFGSGVAYTAYDMDSPIKSLTIRRAQDKTATLLMHHNPDENVWRTSQWRDVQGPVSLVRYCYHKARLTFG